MSRQTLVLGGTGFIGPHVVEALRRRGREVVVFNRGQSSATLPAGVRVVTGDRDPDVGEGLSNLAHAIDGGTRFEAVIDLSCYLPRHAEASARLLAPACDRFVFVSTISVYDGYDHDAIDEDAPLGTLADPTVEEITGATYGPLKVLCEARVREALGAKGAIVRPGLVVGPGDHTDRFTYWPVRCAQGGRIPFPAQADPERAFAQWIDGRDLAALLVELALREADAFEGDLVVNAVGPATPTTLREVVEACLRHAPSGTELVEVPESRFVEAGIRPFGGCPLWIPQSGPDARAMRGAASISNARALAQGLALRPLAETVADTLAWFRASHPTWSSHEFGTRPKQGGLSRAQEAALLADA